MEWYGEYQTTLRRALKEIDRNYESYDALVVAGTHNPKDYDIEKIIEKIKQARLSGRPGLYICFGHQVAGVEYARNVLGIKDATSEEWGQGTYVVRRRPTLKVGLHEGASYWNNYEVELPNWKKEKSQFTTQAHPEYDSSIDRPSPFLISFLNYAKQYTK